tara:strand:- start:5585 stop:6157 length:573 start_codon:yes stop_codon:yes gene_type:complete
VNHLAHLFLAPDEPVIRIGSVCGDFLKGISIQDMPPAMQIGIRHHLAVDGYTDRHPEVLASKRLFSIERRRFAGVALDVLYDHYLLKNWAHYSAQRSNGFISQRYDELEAFEHLMPPAMLPVARQIRKHDWFGQYRDLDNIGYALDRISRRIRFPNRFDGIITEIKLHHVELEQRFQRFFGDLQQAAQDF